MQIKIHLKLYCETFEFLFLKEIGCIYFESKVFNIFMILFNTQNIIMD